MSLNLVFEVWQDIKRHVSPIDRPDAAETLVDILVNNDYDIEHIRDVFQGDAHVKRVLLGFQDNEGDLESDEEDPEDETDDNY